MYFSPPSLDKTIQLETLYEDSRVLVIPGLMVIVFVFFPKKTPGAVVTGKKY